MERNILQTTKREKADWIGHILCRNRLLKHVTEGHRSDWKTREKTSTEEKRRYWNMKEEVLDRNLWRNRKTDCTTNDVYRLILIMGAHFVLCSKKYL
jgi:hypothetical protein